MNFDKYSALHELDDTFEFDQNLGQYAEGQQAARKVYGRGVPVMRRAQYDPLACIRAQVGAEQLLDKALLVGAGDKVQFRFSDQLPMMDIKVVYTGKEKGNYGREWPFSHTTSIKVIASGTGMIVSSGAVSVDLKPLSFSEIRAIGPVVPAKIGPHGYPISMPAPVYTDIRTGQPFKPAGDPAKADTWIGVKLTLPVAGLLGLNGERVCTVAMTAREKQELLSRIPQWREEYILSDDKPSVRDSVLQSLFALKLISESEMYGLMVTFNHQQFFTEMERRVNVNVGTRSDPVKEPEPPVTPPVVPPAGPTTPTGPTAPPEPLAGRTYRTVTSTSRVKAGELFMIAPPVQPAAGRGGVQSMVGAETVVKAYPNTKLLPGVIYEAQGDLDIINGVTKAVVQAVKTAVGSPVAWVIGGLAVFGVITMAVIGSRKRDHAAAAR